MHATLRILLIVLAMIVAAGCISGRRKGQTGTNTTVGTGSGDDGPWNGGGTAQAIPHP